MTGKFVCQHEGCGKAFNRRDYLDRHAANHLEVKPYHCATCDRFFARHDLYENHLQTKLHVKRMTEQNDSTDRAGDIGSDSNSQEQPSSNDDLGKEKKRRRRTNKSYPSPSSSGNDGNEATDRVFNGSDNVKNQFTPTLTLNGVPASASSNAQALKEAATMNNDQIAFSFSWLFDDQDPTPYDALYTRYNDIYWNNALRLDTSTRRQYPPTRLSSNFCCRIREILDPLRGCDHALSDENLGYYVDVLWGHSEVIHSIVHRPTFDVEAQAPETMATCVVVGMALSRNHEMEELAKALYSRVFVSIKNALTHVKCESSDVMSFPYGYELSLFVAICLLMRYESHIMGGETEGPYCVASGKWLIEKYMWYLVPRAGLAERPGQSGSFVRLGHLDEDGYHLLDGPPPEHHEDAENFVAAQWKEWARYESSKRTALCALFCDAVHKLENGKGSSPLTIFDLNCHMPTPEILWNAQSPNEFLAIVGTERVVRSWSYLKTVKSMLRFPSLSPGGNLNSSMFIDPYVTPTTPLGHKQQYPWPLFTLNTVLYGLLSVARCINSTETDLTFQETEVGKRLNSMWTVEDARWRMDLDRGILLRLARGFDKWAQVFEFSSTAGGDEKASETHYPFTAPEFNALQIENFNLVGQMAKQIDGGAFLEFVLLILLNYHSAMMLMNEEIRLVALFANHLPYFLAKTPVDANNSQKQIELLQKFVNGIPALPEYRLWLRSSDSKRLVTCACLFLVRVTRAKRLLDRDRVENLMLGMVTYYSVLIIWMYKGCVETCPNVPTNDTLVIEQATQYLHRIWCETTGIAANTNFNHNTGPAVVVALGAWLLRGIPIGKEQTGGQILHALYSSLIPTRDSMYLI